MNIQLNLDIHVQPDEETCGPTCLHALYRYYGDNISLPQLVQEVPSLPTGGTLGVMLACHALRRGYRARIYTYNLQVFDPTWFRLGAGEMRKRLAGQRECKQDEKLQLATASYVEFLEAGGRLLLKDLTRALIRKHLNRGHPILTGCSATFLYQCAREHGAALDYDDIRGEPQGHFVVLCGYDRTGKTVTIADPLRSNPLTRVQHYTVPVDRLINAILLGIVTYDANLLVITPEKEPPTTTGTPCAS